MLHRHIDVRRSGRRAAWDPEEVKPAPRRVPIVSLLVSLPKIFDRSPRVIGWR